MRPPAATDFRKALPLRPQNPTATDRHSLHLLVLRVETASCRTRQRSLHRIRVRRGKAIIREDGKSRGGAAAERAKGDLL